MSQKKKKKREELPEVENVVEPERTEPPPGLVCPSCECTHLRTIATRKQPNGKIRRRRQCERCHTRFSTNETAIN